MENFIERNVNFLNKIHASKIRILLMTGFSKPRGLGFSPLRFTDEPSIPTQLAEIYRRLDLVAQERFANAVRSILVRWLPDRSNAQNMQHYAHSLCELIYLVQLIRAGENVSSLVGILSDGRLNVLSDTDHENVVSEILGTLLTFIPYERKLLRQFFERLYFSTGDKFNDRIDDRFAAQLFIGLCKCDPDAYPIYLPRFLQIITRNTSDVINLKYTFAKFAEIVTLRGFCANLDKLPSDSIDKAISLLCRQRWSPFALEEQDVPEKEAALASFGVEDYVLPDKVYIVYNPNLSFGYEKDRFLLYDQDLPETNRYLSIVFPVLKQVKSPTYSVAGLSSRADEYLSKRQPKNI